MPTNLHTHDLVLQLKDARMKKGLTLQEIYDKIEEIGLHVGFTSIKKVFSEGSEDLGFRYHDTIEPIEKVLLKNVSDDGDAENAILLADLDVKAELIARLERDLLTAREESDRKRDFLMHQIELKDQRIDTLMSRVTVLIEQLQKLLDKCDNCQAKRLDDQ